MTSLFQDLGYALRTLRKSPGFTAAAVLTLALGIGANAAIFSVVNAILLRPLPYPDSDRLVSIWLQGFQGHRVPLSHPDLDDLRSLKRDVTGAAGYERVRYNFSGAGEPREIETALASADLFDVLATPPILGRAFRAAEERDPDVVLGNALWATSFGSNPAVLGRTLALDGKSYTIIGVMPAGFRFPGPDVALWVPLGAAFASKPELAVNRQGRAFDVVARLAPGVTLERLRADLGVLAGRIDAVSGGRAANRSTVPSESSGADHERGRRLPAGVTGTDFRAVRLRDDLVGNVRTPLLVLLGAVGLVLLISCVNVANLLLSRAAARRREIAIRRAVGASRGRLVRQLVTESVVLAVAGAGAGLILCRIGLGALLSAWSDTLPRAGEIGIDARVLGVTAAIALLVGVAFGLAPAVRASALDVDLSLRQGGFGVTGGEPRRAGDALVTGEVALALVLCVGAGLLVRSFVRLLDVNPGYRTHGILAARIRLTPVRYGTRAQQVEFFASLRDRLATIPGISGVSLSRTLPLGGGVQMLGVDLRGILPADPQGFIAMGLRVVAPHYFHTLGIPFVKGRAFTAQDRAGAPPVAIVNESTAGRLWPGVEAIGRHIPVSVPGAGSQWQASVVGVVRGVRYASLDASERPEIYLCYLQTGPVPEMWMVMQAGDRPLRLASAVRHAVRQQDPEQPVGELGSLEQQIWRETAARRLDMTLMSLFAALGLGLAVIGIYGVTAYAVVQRTREVGIRIALGAGQKQIFGMLVVEGMRRVALGLLVGLAAAFAGTHALRAMLFGITPADLSTFAGAALLLCGAALFAIYLPARRATRVDPMEALRAE